MALAHSSLTVPDIAAEVRGDPDRFIDERDRRGLLDFAARMYPGYQVAPHHRAIADHLHAVESGDLTRVILTLAPRHGKSLLASELFPAWYLGRNPDKRMIACSHTASLAYVFSRRARNILSHPRYPFPVAVASDLGAVQSWDIAGHKGGYAAAGVGSGIVGLGSNCMVIDDPVKSAEEADSPTYRERVWEWWTGTARTRLEPNGAVVVIGSRWHGDDLIGRLLNSGRWTVLHLPALNEEGSALWPERYDEAALAQIKAEVGERVFLSQYQGTPTNDEGGLIHREWWNYYREMPLIFGTTVQVWDTAFKTGEQNDWTVGATWFVSPNGFYLRDLYRARVEFPDLKRAVVAQAVKWAAESIVIEDTASGQSLLQELKAETRLPVIAYGVERDKIARVNAVTPLIEAGRCYLPADASWLDTFVEEHAAFPFGAHDDIVDTTAILLSRARSAVKRTAVVTSYLDNPADDERMHRRDTW